MGDPTLSSVYTPHDFHGCILKMLDTITNCWKTSSNQHNWCSRNKKTAPFRDRHQRCSHWLLIDSCNDVMERGNSSSLWANISRFLQGEWYVCQRTGSFNLVVIVGGGGPLGTLPEAKALHCTPFKWIGLQYQTQRKDKGSLISGRKQTCFPIL